QSRSSILDGGNFVWSAPPSLRVSKQTALTILMKSEATFENGLSYLLASDFDQTLSFNDSGYALWDGLMFCEMSIFECLRKSVKTNSIAQESGWNVSFWFAVSSPLLGVLVGLLAAAIFCR